MMMKRTPTRESRTPMRKTELHRSLGGVTLPGKSSHPFFYSVAMPKNIIIVAINKQSHNKNPKNISMF